jgi:hypothetical protein
MTIDNPLDQDFLGNLYESKREVLGDDLTRPRTMVIGRFDSTGAIATTVVSGEYGRVWVREPGEDTGDAVQAINDFLQPHEVSFNRPVLVRKQGGELHIANKAPGSADYDALLPARPQRAVNRSQIDLALIRPSTPETSFNVYYSGALFTYNRTAYSVTDQPSDLSASVPGSNAVSVKVELDPTTGVYTETVGSSFTLKSIGQAFKDGDLSKTIATGKYLYGWVRLYAGQTSIELEDILIAENFLDLIDDHTKLANLTGGDPHTQYVFKFPTSDSRNIIQPTGDFNPFSVADANGTLQFYIESNGDLITDPNELTNTLIGDGVGSPSSVGNTFIGSEAGDNASGARSTATGVNALGTLTTGNNNVAYGYGAGASVQAGSNNTFLGYNAGLGVESGSGNVFIGYQAGFFETGAANLYIHNSTSSTPLIKGNFNGGLTIYNQGAAQIGFKVVGKSGQSVNIAEFEDSSNNDLVTINQRGRLRLHDYSTTPPLNVTERATAPSNEVTNDIYLDDGSNTASGDPGWRRYNGATWEDISAGAVGGSGTLVNAVILDPASTNRNLIQPSGDWIALQLRQALAQNKNIFEVLANNDDFQVSINKRGRLRLHDANTTPPLSVNERGSVPSNAVAHDIYLDNGTNTASGNPGWRRYTGSVWEDISAGAGGDVDAFECRGTLSSTLPVMVTDTTSTTFYVLPYGGGIVKLYDGSDWIEHALAAAGINITNAGLSINTVYDWFIYDSSGLTIELVAWTNDTTRATALVLQDGKYVKSGELTKRWGGTLRTIDGGGGTVTFAFQPNGGVEQGRPARVYVWNYYNPVPCEIKVTDNTDVWAQPSAGVWRQANGNAFNQVDFVIGLQERATDTYVTALGLGDVGTTNGMIAVGLDSTTTPSTKVIFGRPTITQTHVNNPFGFCHENVAIGKHYYAWLEHSQGAGVAWFGDNGGVVRSGITGVIEC